MKVLFVSSGNSGSIDPIAAAQSTSLQENGVMVDHFLIKGKGMLGYLKNISLLRKHLKTNSYDVIHAHYSLTAFMTTLSGVKPLVVSLMGSDIQMGSIYLLALKIFNHVFWNKTIVKSNYMKEKIGISKAIVIPNGVNLKKFICIKKDEAQEKLGWDKTKLHLFFAADTKRIEKNYNLVKEALKILNNKDIEIHTLDERVSFERMNEYYNACDIVLLSSLWEGSPNVIKEALACNKPIVTTDVGDIKERYKDIEGVFISKKDIEDYVENLKKCILFVKSDQIIEGRQCLINQGLDSDSIAYQLIEIYQSVIRK